MSETASSLPACACCGSSKQVTPCPPCRLEFTSPLHRTVYMKRHYEGAAVDSHSLAIPELLRLAIELMDPKTFSGSMAFDSKGRPLERVFQMELNRVLLLLLREIVSPDVGKV